MDISDLVSAWGISGPWAIQPAVTGGNNLSYPVSTLDARYLLRIYHNTADLSRVHYEHEVLAHLQGSGLSFSVPAPIPARTGSTIIQFKDGCDEKLAALFPFIRRQHPDGQDLTQFRTCGAALAELDQALSRINIQAPPGILPPFGYFSQLHPAVTNPLEIVEHLPLEPTQRDRLAHILGSLDARVHDLYSTLPWQVVHRDFDASNVLMQDGRVSGVLDFEFVGPDLRGIDLARSLALFTRSPWSSPDGGQWVAEFSRGYQAHLALTPDEIDAIPDMIRLYRVVSLIHREGRRRQGLASMEDVVARALALLSGDEWLTQHHGRLIANLIATHIDM